MTILHLLPQKRGANAEALACEFLQQQGLRLIARNYHCRQGEIDLIMRDPDNLVFVEVRYRRQSRYGSGLESVDRRKQRRIVYCARHYLQRHPDLAELATRFDVVALAPDPYPNQDMNSVGPGKSRIEWIRHAFEAN